jgi:hypothetical protein
LSYGCHGDSDWSSQFAYGWHGGRVQESDKCIDLGVFVAWPSRARLA